MYFKNKFHNFHIVFIIIFFTKCDSHKKFEIIENFNISLQYDPIQIDNISENDFFLLDSIKIIHKKKSTISTNKYELFIPTPIYSVDKIEKKEFEAKKFVSYKDRFQIFLILGFIFLFIDQIVLETKTKWVARLNLFNEN